MKRYKHNLSHGRVTTHAIGKVVPLSWYVANPGDSIRQVLHGLVRLAPLNGPFYGRLKYKTYTFSVPIRLLWDDFEDFITGGKTGTSAPVPPTITMGVDVGSLPDQLRIPPKYDGTTASRTFSALPVRALMMICNAYFKDKQLDTPASISTASGADTTTATTLQLADWPKDWMTTIRANPQLGPDTFIPVTGTLSGHLPVTFPTDIALGQVTGGIDGNLGNLQAIKASSTPAAHPLMAPATDPPTSDQDANVHGPGPTDAYADAAAGTVTGLKISMTDLRESSATQRFKEAREWFGNEYPDYLSFLGVTSSDARLRQPEYLGGSTTPVQVSEVLQTSQTDPAVNRNGVGDLYGHGIAAHHQRGWLRYFEEHSIVMTVALCRPDAIYANGLEKFHSYTTKEDWWQKEFEHIGAQEVLNQEVFADQTGPGGGPTGVLGWQDRYYEWRHVPDSIGGAFRTTLAYMTTARQLQGNIALGPGLINCDPADMGKLFQDVADVNEQLWVRFSFGVVARRLISNSATPFLK